MGTPLGHRAGAHRPRRCAPRGRPRRAARTGGDERGAGGARRLGVRQVLLYPAYRQYMQASSRGSGLSLARRTAARRRARDRGVAPTSGALAPVTAIAASSDGRLAPPAANLSRGDCSRHVKSAASNRRQGDTRPADDAGQPFGALATKLPLVAGPRDLGPDTRPRPGRQATGPIGRDLGQTAIRVSDGKRTAGRTRDGELAA